MGVFLYEEICCEDPFENADKEELLDRLKEVLLEFGECGVERVELYGKTIFLCDSEKLRKEDDSFVLAYNRFEHDTWEATYLGATSQNFTGVRSQAIGSKVGAMQHYKAMAVARVLCECYSSGNYCVSGDINTRTIKRCLAYIGKKYGFELVNQFVECRTNLDVMEDKEYCDETFWGKRSYRYYLNFFLRNNFDDWKSNMEDYFKEDLEEAERTGKFIYCGTSVYLASLFLRCLCERELGKIMHDKRENLQTALRDFIQKYFIDVVESYVKKDLSHRYDFSQFEELSKYRLYFERVDFDTVMHAFADKIMFYKSIQNYVETTGCEDSMGIVAELKKMIDEMVPVEDSISGMEAEGPTKLAWTLFYLVKSSESQENRKQEILDDIVNMAKNNNDIGDQLVQDVHLSELEAIKKNDAPMSDELKIYLASIFSDERDARYGENIFDGDEEPSQKEAVTKLLSIVEILNEEDVCFPSKLFYSLFEESYTKQGKDKIEKINFYLNDLQEIEQKEIFLNVIQIDKLREEVRY